MAQVNIGVIAAAGKGTRAYPKTTFIPKPLFKIENKSILSHNIDLLSKTLKVQKIYVIVGHLKEQIIQEVETIKNRGLDISIETVPWTTKGLAADIASLEPKINEHFFTILGDEFYYKTDHEVFLKTFQKYPDLECAIGIVKTPLISRIRKNYSVELQDELVLNLVEKPIDPPNMLLGLGSYLLSSNYFSFFKNTPPSQRTGVIELTDVIDKMTKDTKKVYATTVDCNYFNINSMQDYHHAIYEIRNDQFDRYKVSLIIPTHNNERSIADFLEDFKNKSHEIILVDFLSTDKTIEIAEKYSVRVERFGGNNKQSLGSQIRQGLEKATGDILFVISPDGSFRSKDFPKYLEYMKDSDMVIGTRTTRQMIEQGSNLSPLSRFINLFMGKLVELAWWSQEPRFTDVDCQYVAIWKEAYSKIRPMLLEKGKLYIAEMMIEIVRSHMRCIEIPISYYKPAEQEKFTLKLALRNAWKILKMIHRKKREKI
ncbi:MAG: glycosyltransferase [Leptospiraceae bacterium]|nr:glycosyltransferase [Leptospiraceae bacterium]